MPYDLLIQGLDHIEAHTDHPLWFFSLGSEFACVCFPNSIWEPGI